MTNSLAIDTSVGFCGASIRTSDGAVENLMWQADRQLDTSIFQMIETLLEKCGLTLRDIGTVNVNCGPGSFVGTRIGISVANTIATLQGIEVRGVSGLAAMATAARADGDTVDGELICALNCVRRDIFFQKFALHDEAAYANPQPRSLPFEDFLAFAGNTPVIVRQSGIKHTLEEASLAEIAERRPFDQDVFLTLLHDAPVLSVAQDGALPAPLYIEREANRA